jgi:hypothetical protein
MFRFAQEIYNKLVKACYQPLSPYILFPLICTCRALKRTKYKKQYSLFAQSRREQPLEVNVMVTVEQFCDVCMKNLKMTVVGNNPDEDFI